MGEAMDNERAVSLFVSYAHTDSAWMKRLAPLLKVRRFTQGLRSWHDQELKVGDPWDEEIQNNLRLAEIVLCLVSIDFLASDYIRDIELPIAMERHSKGQAIVIPLILYPIDLQHDCPQLAQLNPLPEWGKPWSEYNPYQKALKPIGDGLKAVVDLAWRRAQLTSGMRIESK